MRPVEFTPEAIIEAGQELQAAGRNITGFALRQKAGGGNPSRLKQVWDEHLASQSVTKAEPVAELPIEVAEEVAAVTKALTERLAALAVELNDKAVKGAERRVHEVVRSAGEQRAQAERELADASQTVDDLEAKLDEATVETGALESKLAEVQATSQAQAVELAQLHERLTVKEQTAKTAEAQHAAELARMSAAIEAAEQAHQEQRKTAEREAQRAAEREAQRAAERIAKAEADQVQATKEASTAREDAAKLRGQLEATQAQAAELLRVVGQKGADAATFTEAAPPPAKKAPRAKKGA
jgi:chromosome segregation ATPase